MYSVMPTGSMLPTTSFGGHGGQQLREGNKTVTIYGLIKEQKYESAIKLLTMEIQNSPTNRAALSLLGHCYYHMQNFSAAAQMYELLVKHHPEGEEYKMLHAQSLHKAGMYEQGMKASLSVDDAQYVHRVLQLQASIAYEQDDIAGTKGYADKCLPDDPDTVVAYACIAYKQGDFEGARLKFQEAINAVGNQPDLLYNVAVCYYKQQQYGLALKFIAEIIERGVREHPELGVGSASDGIEVTSVGNSQTLKTTALIEAFNLKAAIEYQLKNFDAAKKALSDMPPRSEEELDPVSLMNQALMTMEDDPNNGFKKLSFLLTNDPFPQETFGNLLMLYIKYQYYDMAADVLAENVRLHQMCLSPEAYEYLEATILSQSDPQESYRRFDILAKKHIETLRKLTKSITDARMKRDNEKTQDAIRDYNDALDRYIPVLMAQANIYWNLGNYPMVEKIFKQSFEFCSEHDVWKLNVAHVFFMQETKFADAIRYYEPIVKAESANLLDIQAIVLANLCVSYIMTSQNELAEDLMRQIEAQEEKAALEDPTKNHYHLCIVNLVIGTLYCAKGNYEFGVSRIMKSLEPYEKKLGTDTWYYAKRCFLSLLECLSKQMLIFRDGFYEEVINFLTGIEQVGKKIITRLNQQGLEVDESIHNASYEAKLLKRMIYKLRE